MEDLTGYEDRRFWDVPPKLEGINKVWNNFDSLEYRKRVLEMEKVQIEWEREWLFGSCKLKKDKDGR